MEFTIQFVTDERLLIPGTGNVAVSGQVLEIGRGKPGATFPYRSPLEQIEHYGRQHYVLLRATDDEGKDIDHDDLNVNAEGGPSAISAEEASSAPSGVHQVMSDLGKDISEVDEAPKPKRRRRASSSTTRRPRKRKKADSK